MVSSIKRSPCTEKRSKQTKKHLHNNKKEPSFCSIVEVPFWFWVFFYVFFWVIGTYHWGVEARPARSVDRPTLVGWDFAGRDEELYLVWISGHFHVRKSLGPSGGADQPHEGEDDRYHKVLGKIIKKKLYDNRMITAQLKWFKRQPHSRWEAHGCSRGICSEGRCRRRWPWGSTRRQKQQWWQKTLRRMSSLQWGTHVLSLFPHRRGLRKTPGTTWDTGTGTEVPSASSLLPDRTASC